MTPVPNSEEMIRFMKENDANVFFITGEHRKEKNKGWCVSTKYSESVRPTLEEAFQEAMDDHENI